MSSDPIKQVTGRGVFVPGDDIDTDRIIPARFMKCITFDGLGEYFFYDVRKTESGEDKPHNLNDARFQGASIIVSGNNFGCGSSREHAPQAIMRAGFNAVVAGSFAEIFFGNSTNLGIACVTASDADRETLAKAIEANPEIEVTIDVENGKVVFGENSIACDIKPNARESLLSGNYDPLDELLSGADEVAATAGKLPYMSA
ncbi:3-isopropylmalate dehydratase small subunit [Coraliomargarita akajimensis]|uniref:3-isopropylmalate dehydratase n=1 Tax=Coraliomargarita akajimensis (strain DSM 45221 / IAM 15411 / JCM 23193 / KCTC 12865 / 04OKA010-24) TaxID=583355 RepID=D5EQL0_CORAD|nr:3-isopropylmalate dehydratase small subunit [Coraliomargarita akajimensis]ADE55824.1 3-isopropylmalate dehydratase, small subunit [Coraliomargarita akajimensis DSM 45221]